MGTQFPPIAFLYLLYVYVVFMRMVVIISCSILYLCTVVKSMIIIHSKYFPDSDWI